MPVSSDTSNKKLIPKLVFLSFDLQKPSKAFRGSFLSQTKYMTFWECSCKFFQKGNVDNKIIWSCNDHKKINFEVVQRIVKTLFLTN